MLERIRSCEFGLLGATRVLGRVAALLVVLVLLAPAGYG